MSCSLFKNTSQNQEIHIRQAIQATKPSPPSPIKQLVKGIVGSCKVGRRYDAASFTSDGVYVMITFCLFGNLEFLFTIFQILGQIPILFAKFQFKFRQSQN